MSACRCPHCSASGRCQCYECMEADRGTHYVNEYRTNMTVLKGLKAVTDANGGQFPLLGLIVLPRAMAGAKQLEETYRCNLCKGKGYNYVGRAR